MTPATPAEAAEAAVGAPPMWDFVELRRYEVPTLPTASAAAEAWASLRRLLARESEGHEAAARREEELRRLSEVRLEHLVGRIDWAAVSVGLDAAVGEHFGSAGGGSGGEGGADGVVVLVGQPHCGHAEMVEAWAARHGAEIVAAPEPAALLDGSACGPAWPDPGRPWALPRLERHFLRHAEGLGHVRALLQDLASGRAGPGLVGCDSWAWAYLRRIWPLAQPRALTLRAFDADRLGQLLRTLAAPAGRRRLRFCNARTGDHTLAVPADDTVGPGDEIARLAAHCRGNPGVARRYWRDLLRAQPDDEEAEAAADGDGDGSETDGGQGADGGTPEQVVWVAAKLEDPVLPVETDEDLALVLHALLLHGGLPEELLPAVLPMPASRCAALRLRLAALGLVERTPQGRWVVAALGYAMVRRWLRSHDHLIDDF